MYVQEAHKRGEKRIMNKLAIQYGQIQHNKMTCSLLHIKKGHSDPNVFLEKVKFGRLTHKLEVIVPHTHGA